MQQTFLMWIMSNYTENINYEKHVWVPRILYLISSVTDCLTSLWQNCVLCNLSHFRRGDSPLKSKYQGSPSPQVHCRWVSRLGFNFQILQEVIELSSSQSKLVKSNWFLQLLLLISPYATCNRWPPPAKADQAAFHLCSLLLMELGGRPSPETLHTQKLAYLEQEIEVDWA